MNRLPRLRPASMTAACLALLVLSAQPASAALVGHWTFDGHFNDSVGGFHATVPTPPTGTNDVFAGTANGIAGGAASFDANQDALVIPKEAMASSTFTIAFWEFSPTGSANDGYFLGAGSDTEGLNQIFLRRYSIAAAPQGTAYAGRMGAVTFPETGPHSRGVWHFNVITKDSAGSGKWYVDGNLAATQTSAFSPVTADLWLGNRKDWGRDFLGLIDDLQIYNTAARPAMVRALMDQPGKTLAEMFVPVLDNASFEEPRLAHSASTGLDAANYVAADPAAWGRGWTDSSGGTANSVYHLKPGGVNGTGLKSNGGYFYDMTDGDQGVGLILRSGSITEAWVFQSLGTITADEVGLTFMATVDTSVREQGGQLFDAERRISFRSGVTEGRNGSFGVLESMDLPSATRIATSNDPWTTLVELFRPTAAVGGASNIWTIEFGEINNYEHEHPGGAHFGMADGSVRFIGEHGDSRTFKALATFAGHEVVSGGF